MMRVANLIATTEHTSWNKHTRTISIDIPWFTYLGDAVHDYIYERLSVRSRIRQGIVGALYWTLGVAWYEHHQ